MPMRNLNRSWNLPEIIDIPGNFQSAIGGSTVVSQTLYKRGLTTLAAARGYLNPDNYSPTPADQLIKLPYEFKLHSNQTRIS